MLNGEKMNSKNANEKNKSIKCERRKNVIKLDDKEKYKKLISNKLKVWITWFFSFYVKVFVCVALLLGVSAEEKAKKEEAKSVEAKPMEASKKQDKRGIYDHDFGGHDFGGSSHSSFSSHDFGSHGHEVHHEPISFDHHDDHHHHHEKVITVVKKVPVPGEIENIKVLNF